MLELLLRVLRRVFGTSRTVLHRGATLSARIEGKADRVLGGIDTLGRGSSRVSLARLLVDGIPEIAPLHAQLPLAGRRARVTLLLPSLKGDAFYGGAATALVVAGALAVRLGVDLLVVETVEQGGATADDVDAFLRGKDIGWAGRAELLDVSRRRIGHGGDIDVHPDDVFVASAWWDAHVLDRMPLPRPYVYLVQDFEPCFYGNGDRYAMAESTYRSDRFVALCNTRIMYDFMVERGYEPVGRGTSFEPAVGVRGGPTPRPGGGRRRLFVYARPTVARNMFHTALLAINACVEDGSLDPDGWEVVMAGEGRIPAVVLAGGLVATNLGKLEPERYDELLRTVDVALTPMMAPHPNYPTLEMASAGARVVTTRYANKQDLSAYADAYELCDPTPESMAAALAAAVARAGEPVESRIGTSWADALDGPLSRVLDQLDAPRGPERP